MPIFGQVWLWSSLAFVLGAVLCWLLVARPARNRVGELESQLATRARRQSGPERPEQARRRDDEAEFSRSMVPGLGDRAVGEDSEYLTRSYALRDNPPLPPERDRLAAYVDPDTFAPGSSGRDFAPLPPEQETTYAPVDGGLSGPPAHGTELVQDGPSAAATQYLDVSSGSLTAPPEVPTMSETPAGGWFDDELNGDVANRGPEEQAAVPRNRHQLDESLELQDSRLVDDDDDDLDDEFGNDFDDDSRAHDNRGHDSDVDGIASALDAGEREERPAIEDDGGTVFTQRTHPIPGELIRQIDEAGKAEREQAENVELADGFVDDLADEPGDEIARHERTVESEPVEPVLPAVAQEADSAASHALFDSAPEVMPAPELPQERTEVVAAVTEKPAHDLPRRVPKQNRMATPGVAVRVEPTPNALPKRVPAKPRHQIPFGVEPSQTPEPAAAAVAAPAALAEEVPDTPRSLFEPIVPAADEGTSTPPPPHRLRQGSGGGRGPFGPGSAMPLPGGASPSPEFTIKASVAALRYCTPESPQFGRTVAEVWFRTAADAERVGFRPVG